MAWQRSRVLCIGVPRNSCTSVRPCAAASASIATASSTSSCAAAGIDIHEASPRSTMSSIRTCALHATSCSPSSPGGSSARHSGHACATLVRPELGRAPAAVRVPARMLHQRRPLARRRSRTSPCRHALPSPCRLAPQCGLPRRHRRRRRAGALVLLTMAQLARSLAVPRAGALSKARVGLGLVGVLHLLAPFFLVVPGAGSVG